LTTAVAAGGGGGSYDDTSIVTAVSTETSTRTSADSSLTTAVSTEVSTRASADASIVTALQSADTSLNTSVSNEVVNRTNADTSLTTSLSTETSTRASQATSVTTAVSSEASSRISGDASLNTAVSTETSTRVSADSSIVTASQSADTSLTGAISTEASSRVSADTSLSASVSTEASTRVSADTSLATAVSSEISRATSAETSLAALGGGGSVPSWHGKLIATLGDGDPNVAMQAQKSNQLIPSGITTSVIRVTLFRPACNITFNTIRAFGGTAAVSSAYKMAIYRVSDGARLTGELAFDTTAGGINTVASSQNITLTADELYAAALTVSSAGSGAAGLYGLNIPNGYAVAPQSYPGNLDIDTSSYLRTGFGSCATTSGSLPSTLPTITALGSALITPLFMLDNA